MKHPTSYQIKLDTYYFVTIQEMLFVQKSTIPKNLMAQYFLQRLELNIIKIGLMVEYSIQITTHKLENVCLLIELVRLTVHFEHLKK